MKTLKTIFSVLIILLSGFISFATEIQTGKLKVGASKVDINPTMEMISGRYSGIHDPVHVRAIVLDNGIVKSAIVTADLTGFPDRDGTFIKKISAEVGIAPEYLYASATHDHNAARVNSEYSEAYNNQVFEALVKAINEADSKLQPAKVGYGTGKAYVNTNRDELIEGGYHMGYVPDGLSDKTVAVVSFTTPEGKPIAIYSNYPVHAVTMYLAKTKNGLPEVSADLPGYTNNYVENHFEGAVSVWSSGAAGDQNPLFMANYNQDHPDVFDTGEAGYAILEVLSRRLGEEIVDVTKSIKNTSSDVQIWGKQSSVTVPGRKRVTPRDPNRPRGGYLSEKEVEMVDGDPVTIPLHLFMINDIALAGVGGEVFTEIGIHLKEQSLFDRTMMVTVMAERTGYIPTDKAFLLTAEKALSNPIKPGYAEPALIGELINMMEEYISIK